MTAVPLPSPRPTVRAVTVRSAGAGGCGPVSGPALIHTTHRPKETEMTCPVHAVLLPGCPHPNPADTYPRKHPG